MKKNILVKIILLGIAFFSIFQVKNIVYSIDETQQVEDITIVNSNYSNQFTQKDIKEMIENDQKEQNDTDNFLLYKAKQVGSYYKEKDGKKYYYYETKKNAANYIKEKMVNRERNVCVRYETTDSSFQNVATSIVKLAISEDIANNPDEGDYLAWSYGGYTVSGGYYKKSNKYYWILNYTFTYYTTLQQENALNTKIQKFVKTLNVKKESQYSLIKQINDYICNNVEYDYENVSNPSYKLQFTAYAALMKNKAVCQGYATLYYRILKECNIKNRIIVSKTHSWNLVNIGSLYYNVDIVWNDTLKNDRYLLSGSNDFINNSDHIRNIEYNTSSFNNKYPTSKNKFQVKLVKVEDLNVAKTGSNEIKISWKKQDNITGYRVYTYNYTKKRWEYYKQVKGSKSNSCIIKNLKDASSCKIRVRAYAVVNKGKLFGKYSNSLKTITAPKKTSIKSIKSNHSNQIKIGWKKVLTATGYQVQYSTQKRFIKNVTSFKVKGKYSNYKTIKKLKKGKKYYFRVRTYKYYKGKRYYSSWSDVKSIKCR